MPTLLAKSEGSPLQFSALSYSDEQMGKPEYIVDLPASNATVLCLAGKTLGVGQAGNGPLAQYRLNSDEIAFFYNLRLLDSTVKDVAETARTVATVNRIRPVVATRDAQGFISLDAAGSSLGYSRDGITWPPYAAPSTFAQGGLLKVRSTGKSGQVIENALPFDAFVDRSGWKVTASTFELGDGDPAHAIDGDPGTIWHSRYNPIRVPPAHFLAVDMGAVFTIQAVKVTPRTDAFTNGRARDYELYVSENGEFGKPILSGTLPDEGATQTLKLPAPIKARYLKFVIKTDQPGYNFGSLAEITVVPATQ